MWTGRARVIVLYHDCNGQYQYNINLAPTQVQLQGITMGSNEGFKEYAKKWRDLAGRVQPPLTNRELVDMFMGNIDWSFLQLTDWKFIIQIYWIDLDRWKGRKWEDTHGLHH